MAERVRKINHSRRILNQKTLNKNNLLAGMIVNFTYTKPDIYDRKPLILMLHREKNIIDGLNLNYLHEAKIQQLFKLILNAFEGRYDEAFKSEFLFNLNGEFTRIGLSERIAPSDVDGSEVYSRVIKPRILTQVATKNCYRSYDLNYISTLKIIDYKIDVLEKYTLNTVEFVQRFLELGGKIKDGKPITKGRDNRIIYEKVKKEFGV